MKKIILLVIALCLCLTGCAQPVPFKAADGLDWSDDWVSVGNVVGVDTPEGIDHREYNDTLSTNGMYYATWSMGEAEPYINEDGDDAELYDVQIYMLLAGYNAAEKAEDSVSEWLSMAHERYDVTDEFSESYNGQEFTVVTCTFSSDTNPFSNGASAFGVYRNYAVSVELSCREGFSGDPLEILSDFLNHCHYAT